MIMRFYIWGKLGSEQTNVPIQCNEPRSDNVGGMERHDSGDGGMSLFNS